MKWEWQTSYYHYPILQNWQLHLGKIDPSARGVSLEDRMSSTVSLDCSNLDQEMLVRLRRA